MILAKKISAKYIKLQNNFYSKVHSLKRQNTSDYYLNLTKDSQSESRVSKFDWHGLSPIFWATMLLHNLKRSKTSLETKRHHLLAIH